MVGTYSTVEKASKKNARYYSRDETTLNVLKTAILCVVFWKAQEQFVANRRLSLNFGASFLGNGKAYNDDRLSS